MNIQVLSDLHVEFHKDAGKAFVTQYLRPPGAKVDVLLVAGDLGNSAIVPEALQILTERYHDSLVIYVPGNHDYYGSTIHHGNKVFADLENQHSNLVVLINRMVTYQGVHFLGATLWFPKSVEYKKYRMYISDFKMIADIVPVAFKEHTAAMNFLKWHLSSESVVVTHYVPTMKSVPQKYKNDPLTMFFVHDIEKMIRKRKPKLWVHGHVHTSSNYILGRTHMVCNPLGYVGREVNPEFIPNMLIEM